MKLFGTLTSPFVRRVRIVATELGVSFELINTATDEGQAALRAVTPIWKVPTAVVEDQEVIFDSRAIIDYLITRHGWGPLRPPDARERWQHQNILNVIDGALDSAINVFYFERDGIDTTGVPYFQRQRERIASACAWLERNLHGAYFTAGGPLGLTEIALITTLEWLTFRQRYNVNAHPGLAAFCAAHKQRDSIRATYPVA